MRIPFTQTFYWIKSNPKLSAPLITLVVASSSIIFQSYSSGPGNGGLAVSGAPFVNNGSFCTNCHGGGNFGASIKLELLDADNNIVSLYNPGQTYTYRITLGHTSGNPQFGFQTTAVKSTDNSDLNNWGTLPSGTHSTIVDNRHYVEHSNRLTSNIISIPWTAPAAQSGTVAFYAAGNLVNANFSPSGDEPVKTSLFINENNNLPIRLSFFNGGLQNGAATLTWEAAVESDSKNYVIERSSDGINFSSIATISSKNKNGSTYSYTDPNFQNTAFYRLRHNDLNGNSTLYSTIRIKKPGIADYKITFYSHGNFKRILFSNDVKEQRIQVKIADVSGRLLYTTTSRANLGSNMIPVPGTIGKGILVVSILTEDGKLTSAKTIAQ